MDAVVAPETGKIVTDGLSVYPFILPKDKHTATNHKEEIWDKGYTSMSTIENAFSLFKRGIVGNYHKLSEDHLDAYLGEFCWRYNRRHQQTGLFDMALLNLSSKKPMPYKVLTYDGF